MLKPTLRAVRGERLGVIRRLYFAIAAAQHAGVGMHAMIQATTAVAAALNAVGVDKTMVARLVQFQRLVQRLGVLALAEDANKRRGELITLALEIAAKSAELTDTQHDDELVRQAAAYLADEAQQKLLAEVLDHLYAKCPPMALAPSADDIDLWSSWAADRKLDVGVLLNLLPYVIETAHMAHDLGGEYGVGDAGIGDRLQGTGDSENAAAIAASPVAHAFRHGDLAVAKAAEAALGVAEADTDQPPPHEVAAS